MNRRNFALASLGSTTESLLAPLVAGADYAPTPSALSQAFPVSAAAPGLCAVLPDLPSPPSIEVTQCLLPGFRERYIQTSGATIRTLTKGDGPALLLLHGHPETLGWWHKIAPRLAERFQVVLTDLRGYGDSSKPDGGNEHENYTFRAMAQDQVEVMRQLGHQRFAVAGHDRGG